MLFTIDDVKKACADMNVDRHERDGGLRIWPMTYVIMDKLFAMMHPSLKARKETEQTQIFIPFKDERGECTSYFMAFLGLVLFIAFVAYVAGVFSPVTVSIPSTGHGPSAEGLSLISKWFDIK